MPLDEEVREAILKAFSDLPETGDDVVDALQASGLPDKAKWQITAPLQQPRQRIGMVVDAINANPPDVAEQALKLNPDARIEPSLVSALGVIVFAELCVVCLLISKIFAGQDEGLPKPRPSWPQKNSPTRTGWKSSRRSKPRSRTT